MIKLATEPTLVSGGVIWTNCPADNLYHDAAVAHALVKAMGEQDWRKQGLERSIWDRAAEILRTDFGIEESP